MKKNCFLIVKYAIINAKVVYLTLIIVYNVICIVLEFLLIINVSACKDITKLIISQFVNVKFLYKNLMNDNNNFSHPSLKNKLFY
jgi:hypothetical protein